MAMGGSSHTVDLIRRNPHDEYELLQRVGSGTYGDVFKAKQLSNGQLAAVKVVKLEPGELLWLVNAHSRMVYWNFCSILGDDFALIQQEILMMKDCQHPNIIAYFGSYLR